MSHPKGRARLAPAVLASALAAALPAFCMIATPLAAQEAASAVQDVTLADVTLPLGTTIFRAPKITVSGTRLSKDELTALLKADAPEPWPARLARLEAASVSAPVLISEHAGPGAMRQTVTYREISARDVRAGRIAELTTAGAALTVTDGTETGTGTYGPIRATDVDLAALTRLYTVAGDGKGTVQRLYAAFQISDVVYTDASGTTVKLGRLEGRDLGGRQVPGGWSGALDAISAGLAALSADPEAEALPAPERARLAGAGADLLGALDVGTLEARDLSLSETDADGPLLIEVGRLTYASGPEAGFRMEGLAFTQGPTRARLARLALTGVSLAPTIETLRRLARPDAQVGEDEMRRLMPAIGALTLQEMSLDLPPEPPAAKPEARSESKPEPKVEARPGRPGGKPELKTEQKAAGDPLAAPAAAPPAGTHVALRDAAISFGPLKEGVPTATRVSLSGLVMPAAMMADAPVLGALSAYGYRDLDLTFVADLAWDEGKREVSLREMTLTGRDMGTVRLSGLVGGVGPEVLTAKVPAAQLLMFTANAKTLDVTVENTGLFERFIAAQSKSLSLKPDELRQEYVSASQFGVPIILGGSAGAKAIGAAMGQFVTKPGRLVVNAKAKTDAGLGFADFAFARSPAAVFDKIEVDAKAE
ncbi:hypothetical protein [Methylobacterium dankookense]|uniref:AsmA-like C-terminal domain-containing protein n=1 Tax=Methylobacterium dankookense TaxID=560405 RepID=A0A564G1G6_9HYPH|nr:hypothetical protein [Methylobacterium dankookense]GJD55672.1 hypothetical protein IFDJLNFL_1559 [Methylobacterium dankookense]VUF13441.1 hypothetical protein MTDSW087_03144 [Methylobacterium dankookense]